jgi:hypothetical protein
MPAASPVAPFQAKIKHHCLFTLIEHLPFNEPINFSKWLPGGLRKSKSQIASPIVSKLRHQGKFPNCTDMMF